MWFLSYDVLLDVLSVAMINNFLTFLGVELGILLTKAPQEFMALI